MDTDKYRWKRLVRENGFWVCWVCASAMILEANTKAAGVDALLAAVFAWAVGYGTGRWFLEQ